MIDEGGVVALRVEQVVCGQDWILLYDGAGGGGGRGGGRGRDRRPRRKEAEPRQTRDNVLPPWYAVPPLFLSPPSSARLLLLLRPPEEQRLCSLPERERTNIGIRVGNEGEDHLAQT